MLRLAILAVVFVPSILAAVSREDMASALIAAEDTETLEETFKTFEKEHVVDLSYALRAVAEQEYQVIVTTCLRMAHDPFPKDEMRVCGLVYNSLLEISNNTLRNTESFTKMVTSFKPSDAKPLATIRICTFWRDDGVNVLKSVMIKSPELITGDLPNWLACHKFDRNSRFYSSAREESFKYLTSFATQGVLEKALAILEKNEHYEVYSQVLCCKSQNHFPKDLFGKINDLLIRVKVRKARIREALTFLPTVIINLMLEYTTCDIPPNRSNSSPKTTARSRCIIS